MDNFGHTRAASRTAHPQAPSRRPRKLLPAALALGLLLLAVPTGAQAATLTVTSTADPASSSCTSSSCTLRAAIALADSDGGSDTIELPAGVYQLTSAGGGVLPITASMTIVGAGARTTTILPAPASQIFNVEGGTVALENLTLTGAAVSTNGGALEVRSSAALTLLRDTFSDNDVLVKSNYSGGAIYDTSTAPLLIEASTFSDNTGYNGGAIASGAPARIVNSTFTGNHAGSPTFNGDDGAVSVSSGELINDTIVGNECFNGSGCGGGVGDTKLSVADTIIAANTDEDGALTNCSGTITVTGPDLEDGTDCGFTTDGSKRANPLLGPLANNGGPTETMLPAASSPVIGSGTDATCATHDQRGGARPAPGGGQCDIGAIEVDSLADVAITGTVAPTSVLTGAGVLYTLTVTDLGPDPALDTSVQNLLPAGATLAGAITSTGTCSGSTTLLCTLGTLQNGASATIDVSAHLSTLGTATDVASVSAPATDPVPTNNQVSILSTVLAPIAPTPPTPIPALTGVSQTHTLWRVGNRLATLSRVKRKKPPVGTTFAFSLNAPAQVGLVFTQLLPGRNLKGKCVAATPKNHHLRGCKRTVPAGTLSFAAHTGANKVSFQGLLAHGKRLQPGRYTVLITATNSAGHSRTQSLNFTIVK
jgi:CSLREA domain-containing protein/uncharacterized repeat protein (TIGR01451 family)